MLSLYEIHWYGAYSNVKEAGDTKNILYMWTGQLSKGKIKEYQKKKKSFTRTNAIRYVGRTINTINKRVQGVHHSKEIRASDRQFWVGKIAYARASNIENSAINNAEKLLIYYLYNRFNDTTNQYSSCVQLLNSKCTQTMNVENFGVINRWFFAKQNRERDARHLPWFNKFFDDIIIWNGSTNEFITSRTAVKLDDSANPLVYQKG